MGFHGEVGTREDLSIDVSISYYSKTDIDEARVISFLRERTDGQTRFWNPRRETFFVETKNFNSKLMVSCRFLNASPEDGDA